jgi:hypothetical protein
LRCRCPVVPLHARPRGSRKAYQSLRTCLSTGVLLKEIRDFLHLGDLAIGLVVCPRNAVAHPREHFAAGSRRVRRSTPRGSRALCCVHRGAPLASSSTVSELISRSCWHGQCPQPGDQRQDIGKHLPRYRDFGHLNRHSPDTEAVPKKGDSKTAAPRPSRRSYPVIMQLRRSGT